MLMSRTLASRLLLSPILSKRFIICASFSSFNLFFPATQVDEEGFVDFNSKDVALSFKDWFQTRDNILLDRIFEILATKGDDLASGRAAELELCRLQLKLSEEFVLKVLKHGKDVLSCLKFFDWAGRQNGYSHTRATFNAIFKILSREKMMALMLEFLKMYMNQRHLHKVRFNDTLVMGYAVAGKLDVALQLFGRMRFQGLDLDPFAYHVLLNALVEESCFDAVDVISKQISLRGFENELTMCIRVKNLCKQKRLKEAEAFVRRLEGSGGKINDHTVAVLVDAFCKRNKFEEAARLVEDFPQEQTYAIWIKNLVQAGKVEGALSFLRSKNLLEGYVPDVCRYNVLICRLLREGRLEDVCDLLMEMREKKISPDKITMNAALCFFCKAGMVDVALELYSSRSEFVLSLNSFTFNYLINTLCADGSVDDAYQMLKDSLEQGYFLEKTFSILAGALFREGKVDKMMDLVNATLEHRVMPSEAVYVKFISALCEARRVEDAYMVFEELKKMYEVTNKFPYIDLIRGFIRLHRGDMASKLLIEMQENGHTPDRTLYRAVIRCLCTMENSENQFFKLLEMQLSCHEPNCQVYNFLIDGAGHAKRPDLARKVYEMMAGSGIEPTSATKILMLQSYLKSERIADALNFYDDLCKKTYPGKKLYNTMIVGLCKANKPGLAFEFLREVREKGSIPSLECYEELVRSFCLVKNYDMVVEVVDDLAKTGRQVSSFIGNILLLHSLTDRELYQTWVQSGVVRNEAYTSGSLTLGELVGLFSGGFWVDQYFENLDEVVEQCFRPDVFTYNMLLRRLSMAQRMDKVIELFDKICKKGYQPDRWTYDIIIQGLCRRGRINEAKRWMYEMHLKGFDPTESTRQLV